VKKIRFCRLRAEHQSIKQQVQQKSGADEQRGLAWISAMFAKCFGQQVKDRNSYDCAGAEPQYEVQPVAQAESNHAAEQC
jgi:hypothetical protein